jgi:thermitase
VRLFLPLLTTVVLLLGCSGRNAGLPDSGQQGSDAGLRKAAAWLALEQGAGVPGIDYDPARIMVVYEASAQLPAGWTTQQPNGQSMAASMPNPSLRASKSFEPLTDALAARYGLTIKQQVYLQNINFASFVLPAGADGSGLLSRIRSEGGGLVAHAIYLPLKHARFTPDDPDFESSGGPQWSHHRVGCPAAWDVTRGDSDVIVAVVDTGVRLTHEELSATVINPAVTFPASSCDVVNGDKTIEDLDGHGTFIAGMIAAQGDNGRTITGVSPGCRVLPIKVSNELDAWADDLIAGALLAGQLGARAINYSWGGTDDIPVEEDMVDQLVGEGRLFVCAAGNDGVPSPDYPAAFPNALAVGATTFLDDMTDFSNYGAYVDVAAPGEELKSCSHTGDSSYDAFGSGTSYAAPMVVAAAGLLWSYRPELTLAEVRAAITGNGPVIPGFNSTVRRLDIAAALDSVFVNLTPTIAGVTQGSFATLGIVPGKPVLGVSLTGTVNVVRAEYTLDLAPVGTAGPEDITKQSTAIPFSVQMNLVDLPNQTAELSVRYFSSSNDEGSRLVTPLWIFNQRGDIDGDGAVGGADLTALTALIGTRTLESGYVGFADSDLDGTITEADGAAIGYNWGIGATGVDVTAVQPLSALTGAQVAVSATVTGSGQLTYAWDFGGGGVPDTSALPAPTITAGAPGDYPATVTVTNEFGSDTFDFTFTVEPRPGPAAAFEASPATGLAPLDVSFDAGASGSPGGSIATYEWDWTDDGTWDEITDLPDAFHQFTVLGDYTTRLRVTDDLGATAETTRAISVIDGFTISNYGEIDLGPFGSGNSADNRDSAVAEIDGKPAVAWIERTGGGGDESFWVAVATVETPTMIAEWRIDKVFTGNIRTGVTATVGICDIDGEAAFLFDAAGELNFGRYHGSAWTIHTIPGGYILGTLAEIAGKPAILIGADTMFYIHADSSDPAAAADWNIVQITAPNCGLGGPYSYMHQLMEIGGKPVYQNESTTSGDWRVVSATANPPGPSDWVSCTFDGDHTGSDQFGYMFDDNGLPATLFYVAAATGGYFYRKAVALLPDGPEDWTPLGAPTNGGHTATVLNGLPACANFYGDLSIALTPSPTSSLDWVDVTTPNGFRGDKMVDHGGLPAYFEGDGRMFYRYPIQ